jgi:adenylate kinase family enzyme
VDRSVAYAKKELDFIHDVLELGLLLENEHFPLSEKIISLYLNKVGLSERDALVLNGIPRHVGQAGDIATAVVVLDCSPNDVLRRIRDNVGGDRTGRIDDNKVLIEKKLSLFRERTTPLIDHYARSGQAIYRIRVSGNMTPLEVYCTLSALAAVDPPISLVAEPPER